MAKLKTALSGIAGRTARKTEGVPARTPRTVEAAPDFDRLVHERLRLGILSALAAGGEMTFNELKKLLEATDGNLSVHARKLEDAAYIVCEKSFAGRMPRTEFRITAAGRRALSGYLDSMEEFIRKARSH